MKRMILAFSFLTIMTIANAQSLIQKFVQQKFILSDSFKSPDGYYFGAVTYGLQLHSILMIRAVGTGAEMRPNIFLRGPIKNEAETTPTIKLYDTTTDKTTNEFFVINKAGDYTIYFANGRMGKKGEIMASIGLASTEWLDNTNIFPMAGNTPLAASLGTLLRHAIFQFNLVKGERLMFGGNKPSISVTGADMGSAGTIIDDETVLDVNLKEKFSRVCNYEMGVVKYKSLAKNKEDYSSGWDQQDSTLAIKNYDNLKSTLLKILATDFIIERETVFPLYYFHRKGDWIRHGRSIVFKHKGNRDVIDPANEFYFLAGKNMRVELSLRPDTFGSAAELILKVYSY